MKRAKLAGLLAKIETVEGTDAVPVAGTDGIQLEEGIWGSVETDYLERNLRENATGNRMGRHGGAQPAGPWAKVTVTAAVKGTGVAYAAATRPELDVLLRACGLQATVLATPGAEKITYAPIDDAHESVTLYAYAAGSLYKLLGCHGSISSVSIIPARIAIITFELWGQMPAVPTDVALPNIVYPRRALKPPVAKAEGMTLNGYGALFKSFNWKQNATVTARTRGGAPEGHAGYAITDYDPSFTSQLDSPVKSVFDPWALERAGTEFAWLINLGTVQYNTFKLSGGNGQITKVPQAEDGGYAMIDLNVRCLHGAAAAAFAMEFS